MAPSQLAELDVSAELDRIVLQCLEKSPDKRPQSANELWNLLDALPFREPWSQERALKWWRNHLPNLMA